MIYYQQGDLLIRDLTKADCVPIRNAEVAQGWRQSVKKYYDRLKDAERGKCVALVAVYGGEPVGYVNVYPASEWGPWGGRGFPEIVDFGVIEKMRRRGIGTKLMDVAEEIAARYADRVYLGVGLHTGYGSAQRMYVKRGYLPDGSGVWFHDGPAQPYENYELGDDLVLYLIKFLKKDETL